MSFLAVLAVLAVLAAADDPSPTPMLDKLAEEATRDKAEFPDRWAGYQGQVERAVADHAKRVTWWMKRSSPPPLDLKPLGLPLTFLVAEGRRLGEAPDAVDPGKQVRQGIMPGSPLVLFEWGRSERHQAYLDAMAHNPDDRRIDALLEYRDVLERRWPGIGRGIPWPGLIARAATRDWAAARIRELARESPRLDPNNRSGSIHFLLIDRFAGELPPDAATIAYDYLRAQDPLGPHGYDGTWDVLLRLDPPRARREILPYFHSHRSKAFDFNIYVVMLLRKHAGPSKELAKEVRTWLAKDNIDTAHRRDFRVILLRADPEHELKPAIEHIDRLLIEQARAGESFSFQGDVAYLVHALGEIGSKEADDAQARYAFERAIPETTRALALESLARRNYDGAQALLARWLAEEAPHMQAYLRKKAAEDWGDSGRLLLQRIDLPR